MPSCVLIFPPLVEAKKPVPSDFEPAGQVCYLSLINEGAETPISWLSIPCVTILKDYIEGYLR